MTSVPLESKEFVLPGLYPLLRDHTIGNVWSLVLAAAVGGHERVEGDDAPPTGLNLRELAWNGMRLIRHFAKRGPRGPLDGQPVLVIPGFLATDRTTMELRRALARAGWRAHPWLLGLNGAEIVFNPSATVAGRTTVSGTRAM